MNRWVTGLVAASLVVAASAGLSPSATAGDKKPRTGFEKTDGAAWTTHRQELQFLAEVDRLSSRVVVDVIGQTAQKRPLHLVRLGASTPRSRGEALREPVILFTCSQHGNEPAGREACLITLRDLAFTTDKALIELLETTTVLFVPTANPDGREANTRANSLGVDTNRDHLNLTTPETRAIAAVVRDWEPESVVDLHEYGPSLPALYDDEILYLWPRNLNIDEKIHDLAKSLALDYIKKEAEENGYTADEYGMYALGPQDVQQTAGDEDEGIARNLFGLRHSLGILVESAVSPDATNGPDELTDPAAVNRRRVESQVVVVAAVLHFMQDHGDEAADVTAGAAVRKTLEGAKRSAPVYWYGADNDPPAEGEYQDPPPCGYLVSGRDAKKLNSVFQLLGIEARPSGSKVYVSLAQPAEPLIPLLLDERARRHAAAAKPVMKC